MFASDVLNSNQFKSYLSVINVFMNFIKGQVLWKVESIALPHVLHTTRIPLDHNDPYWSW